MPSLHLLVVIGCALSLTATGCRPPDSTRRPAGAGSADDGSSGSNRVLQTRFPPPRADGTGPEGMLIEQPITTTSRIVLFSLEWKYARQVDREEFADVQYLPRDITEATEYLSPGNRERRLWVARNAIAHYLFVLQERSYDGWRTSTTLRID